MAQQVTQKIRKRATLAYYQFKASIDDLKRANIFDNIVGVGDVLIHGSGGSDLHDLNMDNGAIITDIGHHQFNKTLCMMLNATEFFGKCTQVADKMYEVTFYGPINIFTKEMGFIGVMIPGSYEHYRKVIYKIYVHI